MDVVEFAYYGAPAPTPKEQLYTELVDGLRGSDPCIGSGSQVFFFPPGFVSMQLAKQVTRIKFIQHDIVNSSLCGI